MQRYLAEIFRLQQDHEVVSLSMLAEHAETSLQAASRMIRRLKEMRLIDHEPYQGVRLTSSGRRLALPVIRRHRLAETFLVQIMRFGWDEVHDMADQFVLGVTDVLEERMDELCGHPTRCPHGEPIPSPDGVLPVLNDLSLMSDGLIGQVVVSRVRTHDPEKLRYLAQVGLTPGREISVVHRAPFNGPLRIQVGREELVIGAELAQVVWVQPKG